eukprot:gene20847-24992_t
MDLKRQLVALNNKILNSHGFTPRAQKPDTRAKIHVGDAPTQPPVVPVPAAAEDSDDDGPTVPAPFNSCEWEGMGGLVPQFKVPNTVTFVDIVQAGRDPRALQFQNFNFGVDDTNSGILFDDSDTGSDSDVTVCQHESVLDEPVVPPPPQTFG